MRKMITLKKKKTTILSCSSTLTVPDEARVRSKGDWGRVPKRRACDALGLAKQLFRVKKPLT